MIALLKIFFFIAIFLGGLYLYTNYTNINMVEGLTTMNGELRCPNLLIQKGSKYFLYNSNIAQVPGVNPIEFNNLEEYVEFLEWQRGAGIRCPVLYLQNTYDAQGERVYKMRPSVTELQGGLPPSIPGPTPAAIGDSAQINNENADLSNPNADLSNQVPINQSSENLLYSADAMDANWGGAAYTQSLIDSGYYAGNEVSIGVA